MKKFDWIKPIDKIFLILKISGLWPEHPDDYTLNLYSVWSFLCITAFTFAHPFFQLCQIVFVINDLDAFVSLIYITLPELLISVKAYIIVKNMKILKRLMKVLQSETFQPKNKKQLKMAESCMQFCRTYINIFGISAMVATFFIATYPIFDNSYKEYKLPFTAWYPFDIKRTPYYEITYVHQIFGVSFCACTAVSVDALIFANLTYIKAQFDILCDELRHFCDLEDPTYARRQLLSCVNHHQTILRFAADFTKYSNWIIFGQFFISAVSIGLTMFLLVTVDPFSTEFFTFFAFLMAVTTEIFIYCWFGNEVEVKSSHVPNAIFESNWLHTSLDIKRNMILFVERCQKPLKISAMNLIYLSLETYVKILRASWSYFALLNSRKV